MDRTAETNQIRNQYLECQDQWMKGCGGDLAGYIRNYGSKDDPDHYGQGGEAIYAADLEYLERLYCERLNDHDRAVHVLGESYLE